MNNQSEFDIEIKYRIKLPKPKKYYGRHPESWKYIYLFLAFKKNIYIRNFKKAVEWFDDNITTIEGFDTIDHREFRQKIFNWVKVKIPEDSIISYRKILTSFVKNELNR